MADELGRDEEKEEEKEEEEGGRGGGKDAVAYTFLCAPLDTFFMRGGSRVDGPKISQHL